MAKEHSKSPIRRKMMEMEIRVEIPKWSVHLKVQQPRNEKCMRLLTYHTGVGVVTVLEGGDGTSHIRARVKNKRRREERWQ